MYFFLVGSNVFYSLSPIINSYIFFKISLRVIYLTLSSSIDLFYKYLILLLSFNSFLNVTIPYKNIASRFVNYISRLCSNVFSINFVYRLNETVFGSSTDGYAIFFHLKSLYFYNIISFLSLGFGAASRSLFLYINNFIYCDYVIFNRSIFNIVAYTFGDFFNNYRFCYFGVYDILFEVVLFLTIPRCYAFNYLYYFFVYKLRVIYDLNYLKLFMFLFSVNYYSGLHMLYFQALENNKFLYDKLL